MPATIDTQKAIYIHWKLKQFDVSISRIAKETGVSASTVRRIARGKHSAIEPLGAARKRGQVRPRIEKKVVMQIKQLANEKNTVRVIAKKTGVSVATAWRLSRNKSI